MPRLTGPGILGFLAFVALAVLVVVVHEEFGRKEAFRVSSIVLVVMSVGLAFQEQIHVSFGDYELASLERWRKAYVLAPSRLFGLAIAILPHEVACMVNLRGYVGP